MLWSTMLSLFLLSIFFISKGYLSESDRLIDWAVSLLIYVMGVQYVVPFLLNKTMNFNYYIFRPIQSDSLSNKVLRGLLFIVGVSLCVLAIFY